MAMPLSTVFDFCASQQKEGIVITSAGTCCKAWWKATGDIDRVLYLGASMSMISMFGAGIALGAPSLPVWIFMGDGAFCMNPGMLMVERDLDLPNLKHFLISNRTYGATGALRLPNADRNDYAGLARSLGIPRVHEFDEIDGFRHAFDSIAGQPGYTFTVLQVDAPSSKEGGGVPIDDSENKFRFGRYIERTAGVKVFRHAEVPAATR